MARHRSPVWKHFVPSGKGSAKCLLCNRVVACHSNTTNLRSHLKVSHHNAFLKLQKSSNVVVRSMASGNNEHVTDLHPDNNEATTSCAALIPTQSMGPPSIAYLSISNGEETESSDDERSTRSLAANHAHKQSTLSSRFRVFSQSDSNKLTELIGEYLAASASPYVDVELKSFKKMFAFTAPNYVVPSRITFSERVIPKIYNRTVDKIKLMIKNIKSMSLTTDGWTACNGHQFVAVTATFIDQDWILKTVTLACRDLNKSHTAINIAGLIKDVLEKYGVEQSKISAITTDRGANMIAAVRNVLQLPHIPCFAHVLNTFVHKVLDHVFIKNILTKVKSLYNLFRYTSEARRELKRAQERRNLPLHKMPSSVRTRWWSEINQLKFVVEHNLALRDVCLDYADGVHENDAISTTDVKKISILLELMTDLEEIQSALGGENEVTCSLIHPILDRIEEIVEQVGKSCLSTNGIYEFRKEISDLFKNMRLVYPRYPMLLKIATFFDPRFEKNQADIEHVKSIAKINANDIQSTITPSLTPTIQRKKTTALQRFLQTEEDEQVENDSSFDSDFDSYLLASQKKLSLGDCPLKWWKKQMQLPYMQEIAKHYLCMTATSVPSERVFSAGGSILTKERYSISDLHVEQIVFLKKNQSIVEED